MYKLLIPLTALAALAVTSYTTNADEMRKLRACYAAKHQPADYVAQGKAIEALGATLAQPIVKSVCGWRWYVV